MKKFFGYIKDFHKDYFNLKLYLTVALFITVLITLNYTFRIEKGFINSFYDSPIRGVLFFFVHAFTFYSVLYIIYLFDKSRISFTREFWIKSLIGFSLLALSRAMPHYLASYISDKYPVETSQFIFKIIINSTCWIFIFGTLCLVKLFFDRNDGAGIYGLRFKNVNFKIYFILLFIMVPLVFFASFLQDFIDYYPVYKRTGGDSFALYYHLPEYISKISFEFFYISSFLNTELFFRGFLIIGLAQFIGKNAVLAMAASYCALHFGKPVGETISSVFGGYILGILALYSRNIWGGVFIHGGTALLMEIFAFWQNR
jgi:hypothetical protein